MVSYGEISDKRRPRIAFRNVQHIACSYFLFAESPRICVIADLQDAPFDICAVPFEKVLDVVAINGAATTETEVAVNRLDTPQIPEANIAQGRRVIPSVRQMRTNPTPRLYRQYRSE